MVVLSVKESPATSAEADRLCAIAAGARAILTTLRTGDRRPIDGFTFHCLDSDKNVIIEVRGSDRWYLKYSRRDDWIEREIAGAQALAQRLVDVQWYQHPPAIRASPEHRYTLYGRVVGTSFNATILRACIDSRALVREKARTAMLHLGECFARFHGFDGLDIPSLNPTTASYLDGYLARSGYTDPLRQSIDDTLEAWKTNQGPIGWIHSNAKSEDIFVDGGRVALIDFGTCGKGLVNEDLCNLCAYLLLLRTIPYFPWKFSQILLQIFLEGYGSTRQLDVSAFNLHVTLAVYRYYLKNSGVESRLPSLSGLPVLKSRLVHLARGLADGSIVTMAT